MTIGFCGDLKNGRTVHSLIKALCHYPGTKFVLISTDELTLPLRFKEIIESSGCSYREVYTLEEVIGSLDVLYMTRIQKERFASEELYEQQKNVYVLDQKKLDLARPDLKILHPLPRVDEITMDVDKDPRALYFKQARYGVYARMALIITLLESKSNDPILHGKETTCCCKNPNCVTNVETYLKKTVVSSGSTDFCEYCDTPIE